MRTPATSTPALVRFPRADPAMCSHAPPTTNKPTPTTHSSSSSVRSSTSTVGSSASFSSFADDDDDLELPTITSKPLSSAASIAKFHKLPSSSSSAPRQRTHRRPLPSSSSTPDTFTTPPPPAPPRSSTKTSSSSSSKRSAKYHASSKSKDSHRHNRLSSLVVHSVTPREASALASDANQFPGNYTEYEIVVENVRSSQVWQVSRRFSTFVYFKNELAALFQTPHCHFCTEMHMKLDELHDEFPRKRLFGSNKPKVVQQRADKLQQYLTGLVALGARVHTKGCRLVASNFSMHLRSFLTVECVQFNGIPGGNGAMGQSVPSLLQELATNDPLPTNVTKGTNNTNSSKRTPLATIEENTTMMNGLTAFLGIMEDDTEEEYDDNDDDEDPEVDTSSTSDDNNVHDDQL